jgi:alkylated DNA nucleotide flippase Atl1
MPKPWREKLNEDNPSYGRVVEIPAKMVAQHGTGTMVISSPRDLQTLIRTVPEGKLVTVAQLMGRVASDAGTDTACPMTTGIFLRVVAEVAELDRADALEVAPYWRVLKKKGKLNAKYPGGAVSQAKRLEAEGHTITRNTHGAPAAVADFEASLFEL